MIFGIGIDLIEISRVQDSLDKFGERFEKRMFTELERTYCKSLPVPAMHFAARFAAKEAFLKALGTGLSQGIGWKDVGIENLPGGQPILRITGKAREILDSKKIGNMHTSLSHSRGQAVAVVVLETI